MAEASLGIWVRGEPVDWVNWSVPFEPLEVMDGLYLIQKYLSPGSGLRAMAFRSVWKVHVPWQHVSGPERREKYNGPWYCLRVFLPVMKEQRGLKNKCSEWSLKKTS